MAVTDAYARVTDLRQQIAQLAPAAAPTLAELAGSGVFASALDTASTAAATAAPAAQTTALAAAAPCAVACSCGACGGESAAATALPAQAQADTLAPDALSPQTGAGARALAAAETQLGVAEDPPGSNDGPGIATFRAAVSGSVAGAPWCAYFASWTAAQAGTPLGEEGQGFGSVAQITDWAQRTGRLLAPGQAPAPGDLILFGDRHVGLVESVNPDGSLTTVEGNHRNQVDRVQRSRSEATGFVRI